jgi:hypothetical protein
VALCTPAHASTTIQRQQLRGSDVRLMCVSVCVHARACVLSIACAGGVGGGDDTVMGGAPRPWHMLEPDSLYEYFGDILTTYVAVAIPLFVSFQVRNRRMHYGRYTVVISSPSY